MGIFLYALELEGGHYYVGQSFEPDERLAVHKAGKGSAWTRLHPFVLELERRATGATDWKVAEVAENEWTLELMALYGWEKSARRILVSHMPHPDPEGAACPWLCAVG